MFPPRWTGKITKMEPLQIWTCLRNCQGCDNRKGFQVQWDRRSQRNQDGNISVGEVRKWSLKPYQRWITKFICTAGVRQWPSSWLCNKVGKPVILPSKVRYRDANTSISYSRLWCARIQSIMTSEALLTLWTTVRLAPSCGSGSRQSHGLIVAKFDLWVQIPFVGQANL